MWFCDHLHFDLDILIFIQGPILLEESPVMETKPKQSASTSGPEKPGPLKRLRSKQPEPKACLDQAQQLKENELKDT